MKLIPKGGVLAAAILALGAKLHEAAALDAAKLREAAASELYAVIELVRRAVVLALYPDRPDCYVNIYAIYPDRVIVMDSGRLWAFPYTIDASNNVTLGAKSEVVEDYVGVGVAMKEALAGETTFLEAVATDGSEWEVRVIRAGLSKNGVFYPDAVLREAAPLFNGARVFVKADVEHLKGQGKDVRNIAGWLSDAKFIEGASPDTGSITARMSLSKAVDGVRTMLADAWTRGKRDLVGLSIDASGNTKKGSPRSGSKFVEAAKISKVDSVDIIVEPGAGGQLIRMIEAFNQEDPNMKLRQQMLDEIKSKSPTRFAKITETATDEEILSVYREALASPDQPAAAASAVVAATAAVATGVTREDLAETVRMVEARGYARSAIASSRLPQAAQERLAADFTQRARFAEADVTAAIKSEREYLARFTESGRVSLDLGDGHVSVEDRSKKIATMLDDFFNPEKQARSFKECYIEITGDRLVTGQLRDCDKARLRESLGADFREALDSTSFSNVLGDSVTRRMVADYRLDDRYNAWRPLVNSVPVSDFRTQQRTRFGGYGDLPIVPQADVYGPLGSPTDEAATYAVAKRGGTESITLEMIKNDDVGAIRQIPTKMGRAASRTLGKFVFDFYRTNPNVYDGLAFFHASHNNLFAVALSAAELTNHRLAMLKQTELNSADRIGIAPQNILVPWDLQDVAVNLFNRSTNLDKTFLQNLVMNIIPVWYWTDTNDWVTTADRGDIDGIEIGFLDGVEDPQLFVQDNPTVGSLFSNDSITYKIRHIYGGNVKDFRCATKAVV